MEKKFNKKKKYKALCIIASPNGLILEGTILTGKEWINILVYDVSERDFKNMFEVII